MSEQPLIQSVKIEYRLDATVTINGDTWIKPGVSAGVQLGALPDREQVEKISAYLNETVLEPVISDIISTVVEKSRSGNAIVKLGL